MTRFKKMLASLVVAGDRCDRAAITPRLEDIIQILTPLASVRKSTLYYKGQTPAFEMDIDASSMA